MGKIEFDISHHYLYQLGIANSVPQVHKPQSPFLAFLPFLNAEGGSEGVTLHKLPRCPKCKVQIVPHSRRVRSCGRCYIVAGWRHADSSHRLVLQSRPVPPHLPQLRTHIALPHPRLPRWIRLHLKVKVRDPGARTVAIKKDGVLHDVRSAKLKKLSSNNLLLIFFLLEF